MTGTEFIGIGVVVFIGMKDGSVVVVGLGIGVLAEFGDNFCMKTAMKVTALERRGSEAWSWTYDYAWGRSWRSWTWNRGYYVSSVWNLNWYARVNSSSSWSW